MIGLIRLTDAFTGEPLWINPNHITTFSTSSERYLQFLGIKSPPAPGATAIVLGSICFQVRETTQEVTGALTRLRVRSEDAALALRKRAEREDWKGDDDYDSGDTADL